MSYLLDANLLIYAFRQDESRHRAALGWLQQTLGQGDLVYAPAIVEVALLRITTNPRSSRVAADPGTVFAFLSALHALPNYRRLELETGQYGGFEQTVRALSLSGNNLNDAYLAALAQQHGLTLVTADRGFARFPGLNVLHPA